MQAMAAPKTGRRFFRLTLEWMVDMKKIRVFFLVRTEKDSGIYTYAHYLSDGLRKLGVTVDIDDNKGAEYDVVHVHSPIPQNIVYTKVMFANKPVVGANLISEKEIVGFVPEILKPVAKKYMSFFYLQCDKIIAINEPAFLELRKKYGKKVEFIPCPVNTSLFSFDKNARESFRKKQGISRKMVLCVASIQKRKGVIDFVKVAQLLPQFDFVWVGKIPDILTPGKRAAMEKTISNAPPNVRFLGFMEGKELVGGFCAADLFFFPSYSETFGIAVAEAASAGVPVLLRNLDVFDNFREFSQFFESNKEASEKISLLLGDKKEHEKWSRLSLIARQKFDEKKIAQKVLSIYMELIEEKGPTK